MSATVIAPTPALPPVRRASLWEKMLQSFKANAGNDGVSALPSAAQDVTSPTSEKEQFSLSTGVDNNSAPAYERKKSVAARRPSMAPSAAPSAKSGSSRHPSISSTWSRRSSRKGSWWRSSNPEAEDAPPVPAIDRKFSFFSSHNPDEESMSPAASPVQSRRPSYVPRNAASSFLKTTTSLNMSEKTQVDSEKPMALKPLLIKHVELRKDSHAVVAPEKHNMHSMAGICDIAEDVSEDQAPLSPTAAPATLTVPSVRPGHKRADTVTDIKQTVKSGSEPVDSARTSAEMAGTKTIAPVISELEAIEA